MADGALTAITGGADAPVVDQVLAIPVASIEAKDRLRPVDPIHAEALAAVMAKDGQDTPIEVCRLPGKTTWLLVTGGHRLEAARLNGWDTIKALVVTTEKAERRRKEIAENLFRRGLDPIDRAAFVAELYALEKVRAGHEVDATAQSVAASARWQKEVQKQADDASDTMSVAYGFSERAAELLGFTSRTLRRDLELHRGLPPGLVQQLRGLAIAGNAGQLRALAKLPQGDQVAIVRLIREGTARGVSDALGILRQKPPADPAKKAWSAFFGGWSRMNARQRRDALRELADQGLPRGCRIVFEGDADA